MKSQSLTLDEVKHVAKLANLPLKDDELEKLQPQLSAIIDLVSKLQSLPTKDVPETSQVTGSHNVWREDETDPSRTLSQESALAGAKRTHNGFFVVDKILD